MDDLLTPKQVAERLSIQPAQVTALIRSGQLRAVDVSLNPGGKPRWRIDPDELESFLRRRTHTLAPKQKRRKKTTFKQYF